MVLVARVFLVEIHFKEPVMNRTLEVFEPAKLALR